MLTITAARAPNGARNSLYPDGPTSIKGTSAFGVYFWGTDDGDSFGVYTDGSENFGAGNVANQTFAIFNGTNGAPIPVTATYGNDFAGVNPTTPPLYFTGDSHSGTASAEIAIDTAGTKYFFANLGGATKCLISWVAKVPVGKFFPSGATEVESFGVNPAHVKPIWMSNVAWDGAGFAGRFDGTHSDIAAFVISGANFTVSTNDVGMPSYNLMTNAAWSWTEWVRFLIIIEAGADPAVDAGYVYSQVIAEGVSQYSDIDTPIVYENGTAPRNMGGVQIPGLTDNSVDGSQELYDRIYVNYSADSSPVATRVEIGNAATYSACTNLQLMPLTAWDTENITGINYLGTLGAVSGKYLYVTLSDNTQLDAIAL
jgi:hypothetical protein